MDIFEKVVSNFVLRRIEARYVVGIVVNLARFDVAYVEKAHYSEANLFGFFIVALHDEYIHFPKTVFFVLLLLLSNKKLTSQREKKTVDLLNKRLLKVNRRETFDVGTTQAKLAGEQVLFDRY